MPTLRRMLLAGRAGALAAAAVVAACAAPATTHPAPSAEAIEQPYVIGPGDHLAVFVYGESQLTVQDIPVQPDGRISLPLAEGLEASGRTPDQLSAEIAQHLRSYVKSPNVAVMVHQFVGPVDRQIRVIGEAADPQSIAYRQHMTVLDVMIETRGLTRFAAGNRAVIVRRLPDGRTESFRVHLADLIKNGDISQNVAMQPGDTLIIPQAWF